MLRKRGECSGENFDTVGLLQTLCLVKMDTVDGNKTMSVANKPAGVKMEAADAAAGHGEAGNNLRRPNSASGNETKIETEMQGK